MGAEHRYSAALAVVAFLFASPARSDLFTFANDGLGGFQSDTTFATAGPDTVQICNGLCVRTGLASAKAGYLGLGTEAEFTATDQTGAPVGGEAAAVAESRDILTPHGLPAGTPGFLVYDFDVTGTNSSVLVGTFGDPITVGGHSAGTVLEGYHDTNVTGLSVLDWSSLPIDEQLFQLGDAAYDHVRMQFTFAIDYEVPTAVYLRMTSGASFGSDPSVAETYTGLSSFLGSVDVASIELLDANRQPVANASLGTDSGTLYPLLAVPEPGSLALLTIGLAAAARVCITPVGRVSQREGAS